MASRIFVLPAGLNPVPLFIHRAAHVALALVLVSPSEWSFVSAPLFLKSTSVLCDTTGCFRHISYFSRDSPGAPVSPGLVCRRIVLRGWARVCASPVGRHCPWALSVGRARKCTHALPSPHPCRCVSASAIYIYINHPESLTTDSNPTGQGFS